MVKTFLEGKTLKDEQEDVKEMIAIMAILPKEDRVILLSNANAFKALRAIEEDKPPQTT